MVRGTGYKTGCGVQGTEYRRFVLDTWCWYGVLGIRHRVQSIEGWSWIQGVGCACEEVLDIGCVCVCVCVWILCTSVGYKIWGVRGAVCSG